MKAVGVVGAEIWFLSKQYLGLLESGFETSYLKPVLRKIGSKSVFKFQVRTRYTRNLEICYEEKMGVCLKAYPDSTA